MKKPLSIAMLLLVMACNTPSPPLSYEGKIQAIVTDCQNKLGAGEYARISQMLEICQKPKIIDVFMFYKDGRDLDILTALLDYEIQTQKALEDNKITQGQATARLKKFTDKQIGIQMTRLKKREITARKAREKAERERKEEARRLAEYYKKHPYEYQQLLQQQRQLELLEQQNRLLADQQMQREHDEEQRRFQKGLEDLADSFNRRAAYRPVNCNTSYGYSSSSTICY